MKYRTKVWKPFERENYHWAWKDGNVLGIMFVCLKDADQTLFFKMELPMPGFLPRGQDYIIVDIHSSSPHLHLSLAARQKSF